MCPETSGSLSTVLGAALNGYVGSKWCQTRLGQLPMSIDNPGTGQSARAVGAAEKKTGCGEPT